jgi:hypothetical protein
MDPKRNNSGPFAYLQLSRKPQNCGEDWHVKCVPYFLYKILFETYLSNWSYDEHKRTKDPCYLP